MKEKLKYAFLDFLCNWGATIKLLLITLILVFLFLTISKLFAFQESQLKLFVDYFK